MFSWAAKAFYNKLDHVKLENQTDNRTKRQTNKLSSIQKLL